MSDLQIYLTIGVFAAVILLIMFDLIDMAVAALLGVSVLFLSGMLVMCYNMFKTISQGNADQPVSIAAATA